MAVTDIFEVKRYGAAGDIALREDTRESYIIEGSNTLKLDIVEY